MGVVGIPLPEYREIAQSAEAAGAYALCVGEAANESIASATYLHLSPTAGKLGHNPAKSFENRS